MGVVALLIISAEEFFMRKVQFFHARLIRTSALMIGATPGYVDDDLFYFPGILSFNDWSLSGIYFPSPIGRVVMDPVILFFSGRHIIPPIGEGIGFTVITGVKGWQWDNNRPNLLLESKIYSSVLIAQRIQHHADEIIQMKSCSTYYNRWG